MGYILRLLVWTSQLNATVFFVDVAAEGESKSAATMVKLCLRSNMSYELPHFTKILYSMLFFVEHVILLPLHIVLERMLIAYNLKEEEVVLFTHGFTQQHIDGDVTHGDTQKPDWLKDVVSYILNV